MPHVTIFKKPCVRNPQIPGSTRDTSLKASVEKDRLYQPTCLLFLNLTVSPPPLSKTGRNGYTDTWTDRKNGEMDEGETDDR